MSGGREKDILTFLHEAELDHYYTALSRDLHVTSVAQLKYVEDEDLVDIGMSRPEMRRLRKFYNKACPKGLGKLKKILSTRSGHESPTHEGPSYPRSPQISRIPAESSPLIQPDAVTAYKTLGDGEFAIVQQGIWTTGNGERMQVALKCLRLDRMETATSDFVREVKELMSLQHEHLLSVYGVVCGVNSLSMVMELAPLRSLLECLKEQSLRNTFNVSQLCEFSHQIADGMTYLESKRIVHRDLCARNVLVFSKDKVKVSDAGLTKALGIGVDYYQSNVNINLKLPVAWCAPECINEKLFTSASDVWAYAVTLWEMFSYGFQPWAAFTGEQVLEAIDEPSGQRLDQPDACPSLYYSLMLQCWNHAPDLRPKFSIIIHRLHQLKPERVQALQDGSGLLRPDQLILKAHDVITVLDKEPTSAPVNGMWKGVMDNGKIGYFEPAMVAPAVELRNGSPAHRSKSTKITRRESARKSMQKGGVKKLSASMISGPKNDLRHTGHIGYDGAVFGDVSFIGDNYDKLPVKVGSTRNPLDEMTGSTISLPVTQKDRASVVANTQARMSYISVKSNADSVNTRLSDSDTLTDVSSMVDDTDSLLRCRSEEQVLDRTYTDFQNEEPEEEFGDFKLPDLSTDIGFDLGPSFMDEVMKALDSGKPEKSPPQTDTDNLSPIKHKETVNGISLNKSNHSPVNDKSPLLRVTEPDYGVSASTFDNVALSNEDYGDHEDQDSMTSSVRSASHFKDSGIMESSVASLEISDYSKLSEDSPVKEEEKKRSKPKLKLIMPSRGDTSKKEGIQPMSASDEKLLNEAIGLAHEFDQRQNAENMSPIAPVETYAQDGPFCGSPLSAEADQLESSWTSSKFGLRKKSPKEERRSFSDEMASRPLDMNEELTPEAQEAYNMLVVKGTTKEKDSFKAIRDRRMNRGMFQHSGSGDNDGSLDKHSVLGARNGRASNLNIRKPQGIPTRGVGLRAPSESSPEVQDTNPLRRLRESQSLAPKPRLSSRSDTVNGQSSNASSLHHQNLNPNMSFFAKLKEQEMANGEQQQQLATEQEGTSNVPCNPLPVPPRVPLRASTVNAKPRERKHMLDLGPSKVVEGSGASQGVSTVSPPPHVVNNCMSGFPQEERRTRREGDDNVFTESKSCFVFPGAQELSPVSPLDRPFSLSSNDSQLSINVKSVTASAHDLGIDDHSDSFWLQKINFQELVAHDFDRAMVEDENAPIPGRYKTSDNVSYEDLMEFALDGPRPRDTDFSTICDEVRLMRRVLSKDVTLEDCMCALEETDWDVHSAIKLLKLKQLLSTGLGDQDQCKTALMRSKWSINEAANYLLVHSSGSDSPDLIHV